MKIRFQNPGVAMAKEEAFSSGATGAKRGDRDAPAPLPNPEEGLRLVHAFCGVKHAALREAIIKLVEELSTIRRGGF
jgi:hypothetical protein